jgi:SAM-dependent methyltransferase
MYAGGDYWDAFYRRGDLDWGGRWTEPFMPLLRSMGVRNVLELGCGMGHDAARLADAGFEVVALDLSVEAISQARQRYAGADVEFVVADVAQGLSYGAATFDCAMGNVSLHMFSDVTTRAIFADVRRVLRPGGLFVFHVNALDDRPLRARWRPILRELEPNYVLEEAGQSVRFFSRDYLCELLAEWELVLLDRIEIEDDQTGEPFKCVWRVAARVEASSRTTKGSARASA